MAVNLIYSNIFFTYILKFNNTIIQKYCLVYIKIIMIRLLFKVDKINIKTNGFLNIA